MAWLDLGTSYLNQKKFIRKALLFLWQKGNTTMQYIVSLCPVERGKVRKAKIRKIKTQMWRKMKKHDKRNKNRTNLPLITWLLAWKTKYLINKLTWNHLYTVKSQQKEVVLTKYFVHQFQGKSNVLWSLVMRLFT